MLKNKHEKEHFVCVKLRVTASNGGKSWKYKECEPHNCHNITRLYSGNQTNYFLGQKPSSILLKKLYFAINKYLLEQQSWLAIFSQSDMTFLVALNNCGLIFLYFWFTLVYLILEVLYITQMYRVFLQEHPSVTTASTGSVRELYRWDLRMVKLSLKKGKIKLELMV